MIVIQDSLLGDNHVAKFFATLEDIKGLWLVCLVIAQLGDGDILHTANHTQKLLAPIPSCRT